MSKRTGKGVPFVKLSGVVNPRDAEFAVSLGVSHIGCVFYENSPRNVDIAKAKDIFKAAEDVAKANNTKVTTVLEFRGHSKASILEISKKTGCRTLQIAGFTEADVLALQKDKFNASRVFELTASTQLLPLQKPEPSAKAPSLFTLATTGTELTFPWEVLGELAPANTFIGGGVRPENVRALLTHSPWGINLCAGVERHPGELDHARLEMLFEPLNEQTD